MARAALDLQQCLAARPQGSYEEYEQLGLEINPDPDVLGFGQLVGITIWQKHGQAACTTLQTSILNTKTVVDWLGAQETKTSECETLVTKVLLAEQIQRHDRLRPPKIYRSCEVSRNLIVQSLQVSSRAIAKMGTGLSWTAAFPSTVNHHIPCHGFGTDILSAAWSYDLHSGINRAFVLCQPTRDISFQRVPEMLNQLKTLGHLPALIPFIMVDITLPDVDGYLLNYQHSADKELLHLQRYLTHKREPLDLFFGAITRLSMVSFLQNRLEAVHKLLRQDIIRNLGQRENMPAEAYAELVKDHQVFRDAVKDRAQEVESLMTHARSLTRVSKTQISAILGMMAIRQQDTSQEIARASKQDGTSMKTMAVMTMLFLPSTAVAAIMAIPFFDWTAASALDVASNKLWIFFIVAIPLTAITMISFRYWLRFDIRAEKQRRQRIEERMPEILGS